MWPPQSHGPTYPLGMNMLQDPLPKQKAYPGQIQPFSSRSSLGLVLLLDPVSTWCPHPWSIGSGPVHMDLVHLSHCHTESDGVSGVLVAGAVFPHGSAACILLAYWSGLLFYRYCVYPGYCSSPGGTFFCNKKNHLGFWAK